LSEALIKTKDYSHARQELENALSVSEKLVLRVETARIHFLLGEALSADKTHAAGSANEADREYRLAMNLLDDLKKEPGAEHVLDRYDLRTMYARASKVGN